MRHPKRDYIAEMRPASPPNLPTSVVDEDVPETAAPKEKMKSLTIRPSAENNGLQKTIDRAVAKGQSVTVEMADDSAPTSAKKPMTNPVAELIDTTVASDIAYSIQASRTGPTGRVMHEIAVPQMLDLSGIQQWLASQKNYGPGTYTLHVLHKGVPVEGQVLRSFVVPGALQTEEEVVQEQDGASKRRSKRKEIEAQRELEEAEAELELARARRQAALLSIKSPPPTPAVVAEKAAVAPDIVDQLVRLAPVFAILKDCGLIGAPKQDQSHVMEKILDKMTSMQEKFFDKMTQMQHEATRGKSGAGEAIALLREMNGLRDELGMNPNREDDLEVDPNNLFGSLMAAGIKGMYGLYKNGGSEVKELIKVVLSNINRTPETISEADRDAYDAELERQMAAAAAQTPQRQLPQQQQQRPPQQQQRRLPPAPAQNPPQRRIMAAPVQRNIVQMPQRAPQQVSVQPPVSGVELPLAPAGVAEAHSPEQVPPVLVSPVQPLADAPPLPVNQAEIPTDEAALIADDLAKELEASMDTMLQDILTGRTVQGSHRWVEEALELWPRQYKDHLITLTSPVAVYRDVKGKCNEGLWNRIETALANEAGKQDQIKAGQGQYVHNNFFASFGSLAQAWKEARETPEGGAL